MFGDYSRDLLRSGIIELKTGNRDSARRYLDRALYMSSDRDVMAEAWYWMSQITQDAAQKRMALENCLANDLQHARARRALAILEGKLKPDEIVDPERLPSAPAALRQAEAQRFVCSKCGGRMTYSPDGGALVCEYCLRSQVLNAEHDQAGEQDFIVAMATARGHAQPSAQQVFHCQGCGAEYILSPGQLSVTCAYCASAHVISVGQSRELLAPDGILPHAFDPQHAEEVLVEWMAGLKIEPEEQVEKPRGLYLPMWSFELGGGIDYTAETTVDESDGSGLHAPDMRRISDTYSVMLEVPIAASRKASAPLARLIPTFELAAVQAFDARYLAAWPAELYDVPMADASLDARSQAYGRIQRELPSRLAPLRLISTSSANLTIESFRLNLLPVWMTEIRLGGRRHLALINGQNGAVQADVVERPDRDERGLREWLADLVKE